MANNPVALDFNDLIYYDKKIKQYVDDKADLISASIPDTYTKDEIDTKIENAYKADLKQLDTRIDTIAEQVASNTASIISHREELDDIEGRILTLEGDDKLITKQLSELKVAIENKANKEDIPSLDGYATEEYVRAKIAEAELADGDVDLSDYYTKSEVDAKIPDLSNLATKEEVEAVQNVAGSNSVKLFAIESELFDIEKKLETIPSIEGLASEQFVLDKISEIEIPEVPTKVSELENDTGYITAEDLPDLKEYVTKSQLDSMNFISEDKASDEYVSKEIYQESITDINKKIDAIEIPDTSNFATKDDLSNLATVEYITNNYISNTEAENFATHTELEEAVTEIVDTHFEETVIVHVDEEIEKKLAENQTINYGTFGEV